MGENDLMEEVTKETIDSVGLIKGEIINFFSKIDWSEVIQNCISVVIASLLLLITLKIIYKVVDHIFDEEKKDLDPREARRIVTLNKVLKTAASAVIWTLIIMQVLNQFINIGSLLAVAGVGTLAIAFGAQGVVEDVLSGFVIVLENHYSVGDYIILDESHYGIVEEIGIRTTSVREFDGGLYIIHNGKIDRIKNFSKGNRKAIVEVGVAYEEDISHVLEVLEELCENLYNEHEDLFRSIPVVMGVVGLDDSAVTIKITCDEDAASQFIAENTLRKRIKEEFDQRGIEIPYNKAVVYTKSDEV